MVGKIGSWALLGVVIIMAVYKYNDTFTIPGKVVVTFVSDIEEFPGNPLIKQDSTVWKCPPNITSVAYLVVGGGGGRGEPLRLPELYTELKCDGNYEGSMGPTSAGGGGAGDVKTGTFNTVPGRLYSIKVGLGGGVKVDGGLSSFHDIEASGGFAGADGGYTDGGDSGSGKSGGEGVSGYFQSRPHLGGGGGAGAGEDGGNGVFQSGGDGGDGVPSDITGQTVYYAGGGAGGGAYGVNNQDGSYCYVSNDGEHGLGTIGGGGDGTTYGLWEEGCGSNGIVILQYDSPDEETPSILVMDLDIQTVDEMPP